MKVAALIIGIGGWHEYTKPLIDSIHLHEPKCDIVVIDNESVNAYPTLPCVHRTERLCYSAAINRAKAKAGYADWYIVLSNDVLCTGPFIEILKVAPAGVIGPCLKQVHEYQYLEGWCVCAPVQVWESLGGWDENYQVSSWEDVDFSVRASKADYTLYRCADFPFRHLEQMQRFTLVDDYWRSEEHNIRYFQERHGS